MIGFSALGCQKIAAEWFKINMSIEAKMQQSKNSKNSQAQTWCEKSWMHLQLILSSFPSSLCPRDFLHWFGIVIPKMTCDRTSSSVHHYLYRVCSVKIASRCFTETPNLNMQKKLKHNRKKRWKAYMGDPPADDHWGKEKGKIRERGGQKGK